MNSSSSSSCSSNIIIPPQDEKPLKLVSTFIDKTFSDDMQRLELKHVTEQHVGVYTCNATNIMGSIKGILVLSTHGEKG